MTVVRQVISQDPSGRSRVSLRTFDHPGGHQGTRPAGHRSSRTACQSAKPRLRGLTQFLEPLGDLEGQFQTRARFSRGVAEQSP